MPFIANCMSYLDRASCRSLLQIPDEELFKRADACRALNFDNKIHFCSIINIKSGNCSMNCAFCSQSRVSFAEIENYSLLEDWIIKEKIEKLAALPVGNIGLVASGARLADAEFSRLCKLLDNFASEIKRRLCVSIGRLEKSRIRELKSAGIKHCHHNLECSEAFYPKVCTSQKWKDRYETVLNMLDNGMEVCSGGLFGIGETWTDRAELAVLLGETGIKNIPINFFNPRPGTPLGSRKKLSAREALRILSVFRNILPDVTLRVCGGRPDTLGNMQGEMFRAGANALMTGNFLTTKGMSINDDLALLMKTGMQLAS